MRHCATVCNAAARTLSSDEEAVAALEAADAPLAAEEEDDSTVVDFDDLMVCRLYQAFCASVLAAFVCVQWPP